MTTFLPTKEHLRHALLFLFNQKKKAVDSQRFLVEVYGDNAPNIKTCETWFRRFKNGDFDVKDKDRSGAPKKFEDAKLQAILDEDDTQTQQMMAEQLNVTQPNISARLQAMGKIQKSGKWVPRELNERQMENRKLTCEMLLQKYERKSFLHRIVTGGEKWIYIENSKRRKLLTSTTKPNRSEEKIMLCVWWDEKGVVYHELLKPGEIINTERYRQQMINLKDALIEKRSYEKVILLHDNKPVHAAKLVTDELKLLGWDVLPHPPYSPDLAPSEYYLFASMSSILSEQHFGNYEEIRIWLIDWFASKDEHFFWRGIHKLPEKWEKCVTVDGQYFD